MGLPGEIKETWSDKESLAYRPAQVYTNVVGAYNVFTIAGPVLIYLAGGRATAAAGGATTVATTFNGVAGEAGAVAINGAVGTVWCTPLNVAGVIAGAAGALPLTTVLLHPPQGMLVGIGAAAAGVVTYTFAVSTWTGDLFILYRKLAPESLIY